MKNIPSVQQEKPILNNKTKKIQLLMMKGTVFLNYMNTNVVYLKKKTTTKNQTTDSDVHNILLCPTSKTVKFPTDPHTLKDAVVTD